MPTSTTTLRKKALGLAHVRARLANLPQTMTTDYVRVNKAVAQELLSQNTHNRPLNRNRVEQHKGVMARGRWMQTGDPIRVSKTGVLLDGAHKCTAIFEADESFDYNIVWGLDDESQDHMDTGSKRSLSHALSLKGEKNPNALGGATRIIWQIDNGGVPSKWLTEPTYAELWEYVCAHPAIRDSTQVGLKVSRTLKVPASPVAAAHYFCALADQNLADDFFSDLGDLSASLPANSPVVALRSTATSWASRGSVSRTEQASLYDVCVRAFEAYRAGRSAASAFRLTRRPRVYRRP